MSRYDFTSATGTTWTVGFDQAIASYFAQEHDTRAEDGITDIVGIRVGEIPNVDTLARRLIKFVTIPTEILQQLTHDGPARTPWLRPDLAAKRLQHIEKTISRAQITNPNTQ